MTKIISVHYRERHVRFILALFLLTCAAIGAHAQGTRKDDIVFNSRGVPLAGAAIRVCTQPASQPPCTPLALIYSDPGLTQALANPTTTDGLGNYHFYAAPGKYTLEISGPSITTKQIPDVIVPLDPSNANFTGNVSAFSLSLSGNLTVNGNTTVVGNLAGGTLLMNNQGTPPGTPASGTVNLYTKSADKRLYYKDDTGNETGPLLPGAATNVTNTFTAPQNIDADFHTKGPNPYYDVTRSGGYVSNAVQGTTGSITGGTKALTVANAIDFQNGEGVLVIGAGPATALTTPTGLVITPTGVTGSTTYTYCVVAEDYAGGRTACSGAASTSTGPATLGQMNVGGGLTSCSRTNGIVTCNTTSAHGLSSGSYINILAGSTGDSTFETTATVLSIPNSTSFTFAQVGVNNASGTVTHGTVQAQSRNLLQWSHVDYTVLRSYVYRCTTTCALPANAANFTLAGVASGMDSSFYDYGYSIGPAQVGNGDVPSTAPTSASNDYLLSTITAGGGTTSLTLNDAATNSVSGVTVAHDNGIIIRNVCAAMAVGGTVYVPNNAGNFPITSTLNLGTSCPTALELQIAPVLALSGTIIPGSRMTIKGIPGQNKAQSPSFYPFKPYTLVSGNGYPFFYIPPSASGWTLDSLLMQCDQPYQPCVLQDEDQSGNNTAGDRFKDVHLSGGGGNTPYVMAGGFGFYWENGGWNSSASSFSTPPAMLDKTACGAGTPPGFQQLAQTMYTVNTYNFGGMVFDGCNNVATANSDMEFKNMLTESAYGPILRTANYNSGPLTSIRFIHGAYADFLGSPSVPLIDAALNTRIFGFDVDYLNCANGIQPLFALNPQQTGGYTDIRVKAEGFNNGCAIVGAPEYQLNGTSYTGVTDVSSGSGGGFSYAMTQPAAPTISNTTGTLASGTYFYLIQPVDANGTLGTPSPISASCTSNGSQACVVSWIPVSGQAGAYVCRGSNPSSIVCDQSGSDGMPIAGTSYTDNLPVFHYTASVFSGSGGSSVLGANGVATNALTLTGGGFKSAVSGAFTANRTITLPDNTGFLPVTSYLNSAYDNANRANGAIGANWTVTNNGINISSNNFIGTAGTNDVAFWSASPFSNPQFSQAIITALNGTTDFPGVAVLLSGSGASTQGYNCVEDSANIFIQKITGTTNSTLTSAASTGAVGDILRLETDGAGHLTCYKNGVSTLTASDTSYTSGAPGLFLFGTVATEKNWSGGNLHPLHQMDVEADFTKVQHMNAGIGMGLETFTASPRAEQSVFLPGALTSTWTGSTWTLDKAITVTRLQAQAKTSPAGCTTNAVVRLTDGSSPVNVTVSAAANDSGPITQNYAAGASLQLLVQTAAVGCTTAPADINAIVQYRMQ